MEAAQLELGSRRHGDGNDGRIVGRPIPKRVVGMPFDPHSRKPEDGRNEGFVSIVCLCE